MTDFSHIRELLAKATPGPWAVDPAGRESIGSVETLDGEPVAQTQERTEWGRGPSVKVSGRNANAALITALRNNAEAMLERIDDLEAGLHRIDAKLTEAMVMDNHLILHDMATWARDLSRELLKNKAS